MSDGIQPGHPVAVFALPMPLTGMPYIRDCIERVYGTGETRMTMDGDSFQIIAPPEGFGPLKTHGRRPNRPSAEEMSAKYVKMRDGRLQLTLEEAQWNGKLFIATMRQWFDLVGGINYIETTVSWPGNDDEFIFVMQRKDGETPHTMRLKAEARVAELEAEVAHLKAEIEANRG